MPTVYKLAMANALQRERSLYLRQHESNPVDWMPWGEPALTRARDLQRPILLSIGYSACHWCHVMARESFEDPETAALMNQWFVNIKVDREERPDIDAIHVRALQAMGRRAGWPLTIFLTPAGQPFWGGTYFPPQERDDLPAFRDVLKWVKDLHESAPDRVAQEGAKVLDELARGAPAASGRNDLGREAIRRAADELLSQIDHANGGLQGAPKFPYPPLFRFLWNQGLREGRDDLQRAASGALDAMAGGGIFDHVGGGFFRYAVDHEWRVPHFEKMLYDNGQLLSLFAEAYRLSRRERYRQVLVRTAHWMIRDMRLADGAFACSLDAESGGEEGGFYVLTEDEIERSLGTDAADFRKNYFDGSAPFGRGRVLGRRPRDGLLLDEQDFLRCCDRLQRARDGKARPRRDDKILADWNGLAILGLAEAAVALDEPAWLEAAVTAFRFVVQKLSRDGALVHSWSDGVAGDAAILDDFANMALAALKLHEVTGDAAYLERAVAWADHCSAHFRAPHGPYFLTPDNAPFLVARICDGHDTATPSGNGVIARVLVQLHYLTGEPRFREQANALFRAFAGDVERDGFLLASVLDARQFLSQAAQVTIVGAASDPLTRQLKQCAERRAPVDRIIGVIAQGAKLHPEHPAFGKTSTESPAAFVCVGSTCSLPLSNPDDLKRTLEI